MKIGIIGSGDVGQALARGLRSKGHDVCIGSRTPEKLTTFASEAKVKTGTFQETAAHGEIVIIATLWTGTESALKLAGLDNLKGKVVIDVTNPLDFSAGMPPKLALGHADSAGEQVQRWLPGAFVVKSLNIITNAHMIDPHFQGTPTMWVCGDFEEAKQDVVALLKTLGWDDIIDLGDMTGARLLEPLCLLWTLSAIKLGSWDIAFSLVRTREQ